MTVLCRNVPSYLWCNLFYRQLLKLPTNLKGLSANRASAPVGINPVCGIPRVGFNGSFCQHRQYHCVWRERGRRLLHRRKAAVGALGNNNLPIPLNRHSHPATHHFGTLHRTRLNCACRHRLSRRHRRRSFWGIIGQHGLLCLRLYRWSRYGQLGRVPQKGNSTGNRHSNSLPCTLADSTLRKHTSYPSFPLPLLVLVSPTLHSTRCPKPSRGAGDRTHGYFSVPLLGTLYVCYSLRRRTSLPPLFLIRTATSSSLRMDTSKGEDADVPLYRVREFEQTAPQSADPHTASNARQGITGPS